MKKHPHPAANLPARTTLMPPSFAMDLLTGLLHGLNPRLPEFAEAFYQCEACKFRLQAANPNQQHPETLYCPRCRREMEYHGPKRPISPDGAIEIQAEISESETLPARRKKG